MCCSMVEVASCESMYSVVQWQRAPLDRVKINGMLCSFFSDT